MKAHTRTVSRHTCRISKLALPAWLLILLLLNACSSQGSSSDAESGSISFAVQNPAALAHSGFSQAAAFDCSRYDIESVEARVEDAEGNIVATGGPWPCDTGEAIMTDVPAGENYTVIVSLRNSSGLVLFQGSTSGVTVVAGVTTDAGSIRLGFANRPPVLIVPTEVQHATPAGELEFTVSASDPDGDNLTFDIGNLPFDFFSSEYWPNVAFTPDPLNPTTSYIFSWDLVDVSASEHAVLIRATDDGIPRMTTTQWVTIQVYDTISDLDGYYPPTLDPISLPSTISIGDSVQLTITATDRNSEGSPSFSAEEIAGKPSGLSEYFDGELHQFQWTPDTNGNYWIRFVASLYYGDGIYLTDYEDVLFTVGDVNRPPRLDPLGWKKINYTDPIQFVVTASDPEHDPITLTAYYISPTTSDPQDISTLIGATFDTETQVFSWQPDEVDIDNIYTIRFRAMDDGGAYDVQNVTITVVNEG